MIRNPLTGQPAINMQQLKMGLSMQPNQQAMPKADMLPMPTPTPKIQDRLPQASAPAPQSLALMPPVAQPAPVSQPERAATPQLAPPQQPQMTNDALTRAKRDRAAMERLAMLRIQSDSPAEQIAGLKMLRDAAQPTEYEREAEARGRQYATIMQSNADDAAKQRALTLSDLGASPKEIMETLGFDRAGIKAEKESAASKNAKMLKVAGAIYEGGVIDSAVNEAVDIIDSGSFAAGGPLSFAASYVQNSDAYNLGAKLDTIKAIIGFDRLSRMREESPTGGALGAVSNIELNFLQSTQGSLDQYQNPKALKRNLLSIVEGRKKLNELQRLAAEVDEGEEVDAEKYQNLVKDIMSIQQDVTAKMREKPTQSILADNDDFDAKYMD